MTCAATGTGRPSRDARMLYSAVGRERGRENPTTHPRSRALPTEK